jgi:ribonucleoside-diphosphate reductase alpha subunit
MDVKITLKVILEDHIYDLDQTFIDVEKISEEQSKLCPDYLSLSEIYNYIGNYCASKVSVHPDYNILASRIIVKRLHKNTPNTFKECLKIAYNNRDIHGCRHSLISDELYKIVQEHSDRIEKEIVHERDFRFDYFGIKTLERSYLLRVYNHSSKRKEATVIERPQFMYMRIALSIYGSDLDTAFQVYHLNSQKFFTFATPINFNMGTKRPQGASCFLLDMPDSIKGIYKTISSMALISKYAGGIGVDLSSIRGPGSLIRSTNGESAGIIPLMRELNALGRYVNQGGKRKGAIAVYLQPWHPDIWEFCESKKNTKDEEHKVRDLFLALWIPDLFMKRVQEDGVWSLMCPDECPGLVTAYGDAFDMLYMKYESEGRFKKQIKAMDLFNHITECQMETGVPYMLYKDHVNHKSNQMNIGPIRSSNLCSEIVQYTSKHEIAVCNLASICLPMYVDREKREFNFTKLHGVVRLIVRSMNHVIDKNFYPVEEAKNSNLKHRPIGIGVQGLANVFYMFGYPFESDQARHLNKQIFENIYYACLKESCELAKLHGSYQTFANSPFSKGLFQFHLWGLEKCELTLNWDSLIEDVQQFGTRNSLLTAVMPTASTSQIMGNIESIEPIASNIYVRNTLSGDYIIINEELIRSLLKLGLWNEDMRKKILILNGSIQNIDEIPQDIKNIFKTAFEIQQKAIIDQAADRGPFIDQSQSMNLFLAEPNYKKLQSCHMYGWKRGLKTGMYYLQSKPAVDPLKFGIDIDEINRLMKSSDKVCRFKPGMKIEGCDVCSA